MIFEKLGTLAFLASGKSQTVLSLLIPGMALAARRATDEEQSPPVDAAPALDPRDATAEPDTTPARIAVDAEAAPPAEEPVEGCLEEAWLLHTEASLELDGTERSLAEIRASLAAIGIGPRND